MILTTFPGRYGDLGWALPSIRAISEAAGEPVDLLICGEFASMVPLLAHQPYLARVIADPAWGISHGWQPPNREDVISPYAQTVHLGYRRWPEQSLPIEIYEQARTTGGAVAINRLDLDRPWITPLGRYQLPPAPVVWVGWSETWFELKVGLLVCLAARFPDVTFWWLRPWGGRADEIDQTRAVRDTYPPIHQHVLGQNVGMIRSTWETVAAIGAQATCFLGCLSGQWVLANALGRPTVIVEPMEARQNPIFWVDRPRNHLVRGLDGQPTFDARHTGDVLEAVLND